GVELGEPLGHHLAEHVGLRGEAGEHATDRNAGAPRDGADGRLVVADFLEELARRVEHTPPRRLLAGFPYAGDRPLPHRQGPRRHGRLRYLRRSPERTVLTWSRIRALSASVVKPPSAARRMRAT